MTRKAKVYLAARYSRREELCGYRDELEKAGYEVVSRWLNGSPQNDDGISSDASTMPFAEEDFNDILAADIMISFTEPPGSSAARGGRHVEFGVALANGSRLIVIGYRENIFHWMPQVEFFETWELASDFLSRLQKDHWSSFDVR